MRPFKPRKSKAKRHTVAEKTISGDRFDGATPFRDDEKDYDEYGTVRKDKLPPRDDEGRFGRQSTEEI